MTYHAPHPNIIKEYFIPIQLGLIYDLSKHFCWYYAGKENVYFFYEQIQFSKLFDRLICDKPKKKSIEKL